MNDLISRQAAIDALDGNVIVTSKESAQAVMDYIRGCADRIRSLPSAQPERITLTEEERRTLKKMRTFHNGSYAKLLDKLFVSAQPDLDSAYTEGYTQAEAKYRKMWDEMPKIILCKYCKHADEYCHCSYTTWWNSPNDFCSKGERRTDEAD